MASSSLEPLSNSNPLDEEILHFEPSIALADKSGHQKRKFLFGMFNLASKNKVYISNDEDDVRGLQQEIKMDARVTVTPINSKEGSHESITLAGLLESVVQNFNQLRRSINNTHTATTPQHQSKQQPLKKSFTNSTVTSPHPREDRVFLIQH